MARQAIHRKKLHKVACKVLVQCLVCLYTHLTSPMCIWHIFASFMFSLRQETMFVLDISYYSFKVHAVKNSF